MTKYTTEQILELMQRPKQVRNISCIAHVDHGKTTVTDSLITAVGLMSKKNTGSEDKGRVTDTLGLEKDMGITIQSTAVSLYYDGKYETNDDGDENESKVLPTLINLIDSPGHVDFSSEVTSALRVSDGALVIVDCLEGVCVQTETVLRQAISERVKPILFLNKLDRMFLETKPKLEDGYVTLRNTVESVNVICETYKDKLLGDVQCLPQDGKVGWGSGLHGWGFTLKDFANMYSSKFGISTDKLMKHLWGSNYYDNKLDKWVTKAETSDGRTLQRSFVVFILNPIKVLCDSIMNEDKDTYEPIIKSLRLKFNQKDLKEIKKPKDYLKLVLRTWLPLGYCLLDMIRDYLPSPIEAQKYRVDLLYTGNLKSKEAMIIKNCDAKGPMSMYVSKMIPYGNGGRYMAFGRVFSGVVKSNQKIRIMGVDYKSNDDNNNNSSDEKSNEQDLHYRKVQGLFLNMANKFTSIPICYAGNLCSVVGIDDCITKNATLSDDKKISPFKMMKFSVAPVVRCAVTVKKPRDLPKLTEGLKRLSKLDQIIQIIHDKNTKENIIAGSGELHVDISIKRLEHEILHDKVKIVRSEPVVSICEGISSNSKCKLKTDKQELDLICCKSSNKLNRFYMTSSVLSDNLISDISNNKISTRITKNKKEFTKQFMTNDKLYNYGNWEKSHVEKIWSFGSPPDGVANILVDLTKGEQYVNEVKQTIVSAFEEYTTKGILCNETLKGCRFNLKYAKIHSDPSHRNASQIIPTTSRCLAGCQLSSTPVLLEPIFKVEITTDMKCQNDIINIIQQKRGSYENTIYKQGSIVQIIGYLPVLESFGITQILREKVGGKAFPVMMFSHYEPMKSNPLEEDSVTNKLVKNIRKRKGLNPKLPQFNDFFDRVV